MVTIIVSAIVEALVKHIAEQAINNYESVNIKGAPSWYMQPLDNQVCVFSYASGGINSIDIAKDNAKYKMVRKINNLVEITIYDTKGLIKTNKDKKIIEEFKIDPNLKFFTNKNLNYSKIEYDEDKKETFIRACIPNKIIKNYQMKRLNKITKEVIKSRADDAFKKLDNEF